MTTVVNKVPFVNVEFGDIEVGEFFKYHNDVYLKTSYSSSVDTNAFDFSRSEQSFFDVDDTVQAVNAIVTIEPQCKS